MIILDTHIWVWWITDSTRLTSAQRRAISDNETDRIGICSFSCWGIAKLVQADKLTFSVELSRWFDTSLNYPGVVLLDMTPEIAIESNRLPDDFHRDPADQIIVATARIHRCPLVSSDEKIRRYPHVSTVY